MGQEKGQQDVWGPSSHFAPVTTRSLLNDSPRLLFFKEYKQILKQSNQHEGQINRIFSSVAFLRRPFFSMNNARVLFVIVHQTTLEVVTSRAWIHRQKMMGSHDSSKERIIIDCYTSDINEAFFHN